jgi:anthranilate synthase
MAYVRAGSTILADSDPEAEEAETRLKAQGMLDTIQNLGASTPPIPVVFSKTGVGKRVLIVDNFDSFVHTLGSYFQQTGAQVTTYRAGFDWSLLDMVRPDLVVISPGPGTPREMGVPRLVGECVQRGLPVFGVCLGLQGIVEHFGGTLQTFAAPVHGKRSVICSTGRGILSGLPAEFTAGRYHSLYADPTTFPSCLAVTARTEDDTIMAIEHRELPITAVQFHPESLMTLGNDVGLRIVTNVMSRI